MCLLKTLKYNSAGWRVPYDHVVFSDPKQLLMTYSFQLMLVLLTLSATESNGVEGQNWYRYYYGRLHRAQDFQFITDGLTHILQRPLQNNLPYLSNGNASLQCQSEAIVLFLEGFIGNRRFKKYVCETQRAHDFMIFLLYNSRTRSSADASKLGFVRLCILVLQSMSAERGFSSSLHRRFDGHVSLPANFKIANFNGTYADFLIITLYSIMTNEQLDGLRPAMFAIIGNVAPFVQNISHVASYKLAQLFVSSSSPKFLLARRDNHVLLQILMEALNSMLENNYKSK